MPSGFYHSFLKFSQKITLLDVILFIFCIPYALFLQVSSFVCLVQYPLLSVKVFLKRLVIPGCQHDCSRSSLVPTTPLLSLPCSSSFPLCISFSLTKFTYSLSTVSTATLSIQASIFSLTSAALFLAFVLLSTSHNVISLTSRKLKKQIRCHN